jgi:hypothetical protein
MREEIGGLIQYWGLLQQRDEERYIGTGIRRQKRARDEQRVRVMREEGWERGLEGSGRGMTEEIWDESMREGLGGLLLRVAIAQALREKYQDRRRGTVPRRLFFAAQQRIAITWSPNYYKKMQRSIRRKNQKEYGPDVK